MEFPVVANWELLLLSLQYTASRLLYIRKRMLLPLEGAVGPVFFVIVSWVSTR